MLSDLKTILRAYKGLFSADFARNADFARRIRVPTLVIGGTADQFFGPAVFEETASLIPQATVKLFEGETHMVPIERAGGVDEAISTPLSSACGPMHDSIQSTVNSYTSFSLRT